MHGQENIKILVVENYLCRKSPVLYRNPVGILL